MRKLFFTVILIVLAVGFVSGLAEAILEAVKTAVFGIWPSIEPLLTEVLKAAACKVAPFFCPTGQESAIANSTIV